jgi:hypothetical protein
MRFCYRHPVFAAALMLIAAVAGLSAEEPEAQPPTSPIELVRKAIANEMRNPKSSRFYMWTDCVVKPKGSQTKQMVETPDGIISRLVAINNEPLTPEQRNADDNRINRLLDPAKMREKAKQQREDEQRTQKLIRALPAAFNYAYAGIETTPQGHRVVKLDFAPNPNFVPPDRETQGYPGMKGQVWIDTHAMRLAKIDGTLFRDVDFGWGILGKLYKGGRFVLEQGDVGNGHWDTTRMQLKFDGRVVLLKHLHIEVTEAEWDFRPVPKMNVRQALEMLRKSGDQLASAPAEAARAVSE